MLRELLKEINNTTRKKFKIADMCRNLGISESYWWAMWAGRRKPNLAFFISVRREYPELRDLITDYENKQADQEK
ncbi:MAG: hypothetical protein A2158_01660 [Chloroflexi bacterium RBG_13_46_14]|nr:MAG: hypothetical protein A2158_01660 [Chloroflexi bacterium RBG_13_46_14]